MSLGTLNNYPLSFLAISQQEEQNFNEGTHYTLSQIYDINYFIDYIFITLVDNMSVLDWTCKTYFKVEPAIFVSCHQYKTYDFFSQLWMILISLHFMLIYSMVFKAYYICISSWPAQSVYSRRCDEKRVF